MSGSKDKKKGDQTMQDPACCSQPASPVDSSPKKPKLAAFTAEQLAEITSSRDFQQALAQQVSNALQTSLATLLPIQLAPALAQQTKEVQKLLDRQDASLEARFDELRAAVTLVQDDATLARMADVCDRLSAMEQKAVIGSASFKPVDVKSLVDKAVVERLAAVPSAAAASSVSAENLEKQVDQAVGKKLLGMSLLAFLAGSVADGSSTPRLGASARPVAFNTPPSTGNMGVSPPSGPPSFGPPGPQLAGSSTPLPSQFGTPSGLVTPSSYQFLPGLDSDEWHRQTNPTIVKVNAKSLFTNTVAEAFCTQLVKDAGLSIGASVVTFELLALSKVAVIRFLGEERAAILRANQLLESQRIDDKQRRQHKLRDFEGNEVSAYINPDKSPMQVRIEMASKYVKNILVDKYTSKSFEYNRRTGIVSCGWCRLGQVSAPDRSATLLKFNAANCAKHGVDPAFFRRASLQTSGTVKPRSSPRRPVVGLHAHSHPEASWNLRGL